MPRYTPDESEFARLAADADVVPVFRQLLADHLTPVAAFELLGRDEPNAFLLESVVGGVNVGRYSFIATRPSFVYSVTAGMATQGMPGRPGTPKPTADPLGDLERLMRTYNGEGRSFPHLVGLPDFTGGLVGYAGYDTARYYEPDKLAAAPVDDRRLPDVCFGMYRELVIFDHVDKTVRVVANAWLSDVHYRAALPPSDTGRLSEPAVADLVAARYADAARRIDSIVERLQATPALTFGEVDPAKPLTLPFEPNQSKEDFEAAVLKGIEYIKAGDIFQFVPSMRLRAESPADPFDVYRVLRLINPSPYMFYLKTAACTLIGSSPEVLVSVHDKKVTTRPLAGTRRRGASPAEDAALEKELLADPKERAEHIMLVDLHRNDIGRVCDTGSVKVDPAATMVVERYSHVMHISSNVTGTLAADKTAFDVLRVSLPVGTVSGAPKIRAMQIIDEVEPTRRGPYGGAVGYFDFAGNTDTCIALRTIVWTGPAAGEADGERRPGRFDVQAGAGVVADSVPAAEYQESMNKAMALLKSVQLATEGL